MAEGDNRESWMSSVDVEYEDNSHASFSDIQRDLDEDFEEVDMDKTLQTLETQAFVETNQLLQVFLRVRPLTADEIKAGDQQCFDVDGVSITGSAPTKSSSYRMSERGMKDQLESYYFTKIFDESTGQKEFFNGTASELVEDFVVKGKDALIFTYGVTNAGKTYTLQGKVGEEGILPRSVVNIFNTIGSNLVSETSKIWLKDSGSVVVLKDEEFKEIAEKKKTIMKLANQSFDEMRSFDISNSSSTSSNNNDSHQTSTISDATSNTSKRRLSFLEFANTTLSDSFNGFDNDKESVEYMITVTFVEIYNEQIYDLLEPQKNLHKQTSLKLGENRSKQHYVKGATAIPVFNQSEVFQLLEYGRKRVHLAQTRLNKSSSRSHCIFSMKCVRIENTSGDKEAFVSEVSFCDLAGIERSTKTQNTGDRLKEANKINTSMMTLNKCIKNIRHNQLKGTNNVVPYRDSKLTRLFQRYLNGDSRACMLVNISPSERTFDETTQVLKFSAIASEMKLKTNPCGNLRKSYKLPSKKSTSSNTSRNINVWKPNEDTLLEEPAAEDEKEETESEEEESESDTDDEDDDEKYVTYAHHQQVREQLRKLLGAFETLQAAYKKVKVEKYEQEKTLRNEFSNRLQKQYDQLQEWHTNRREEEVEMVRRHEDIRMDDYVNLIKLEFQEKVDKIKELEKEIETMKSEKQEAAMDKEDAKVEESARKSLPTLNEDEKVEKDDVSISQDDLNVSKRLQDSISTPQKDQADESYEDRSLHMETPQSQQNNSSMLLPLTPRLTDKTADDSIVIKRDHSVLECSLISEDIVVVDDEKDRRLSQLEQENSEGRELIQELMMEIESLKNDKSLMQKSMEEMSNMTSLKPTDDNHASYICSICLIDSQKSKELEETISKLKEEKSQLNREMKQLETNLKSEMKEKDQEIQLLKCENKEMTESQFTLQVKSIENEEAIKQHQNQIEELKSQIQVAESNQEKFDKQKDELNEKISKLLTELETKEKEMKETTNKYQAELADKDKNLAQENKEQKDQMKKLTEELDVKKIEMEKLNSQLNELRNETKNKMEKASKKSSSRKSVGNSPSQKKEIDELKNQITSLLEDKDKLMSNFESILREKEKEILDIKTQLEEEKTAKYEYENQIGEEKSQLERQINELKSELSAKEDERTRLLDDKNAVEKKFEELKADMDSEMKKKLHEINELSSEKEKLNEQQLKLKEKSVEQEDMLKKAEVQIEQLEGQNEAFENQVKFAHEQMKNIKEDFNKQITTMEEHISEFENQLADKDEKYNNAVDELQQLRMEQEHNSSQNKEMQNKIDQLEAEVAEKKEEILSLSEQKTTSEKKLEKEMNEKENDLSVLNEENEGLKKKLSKLNNELAEKENRMKAAAQEKSAMEKELKAVFKTELEEKQEEIEILQTLDEERNQTMKSLKEKSIEKDAVIKQTQSEMNSLRIVVENLKSNQMSQMENKNEQINLLKNQNKELTNERSNFESELEKKEKELEVVRTEMNTMHETVEELKSLQLSQAKNKDEQIEILKSTVSEMKEEQEEKLKKIKSDKEKEIQAVRAEIKQNQTRFDQIKEKLDLQISENVKLRSENHGLKARCQITDDTSAGFKTPTRIRQISQNEDAAFLSSHSTLSPLIENKSSTSASPSRYVAVKDMSIQMCGSPLHMSSSSSSSSDDNDDTENKDPDFVVESVKKPAGRKASTRKTTSSSTASAIVADDDSNKPSTTTRSSRRKKKPSTKIQLSVDEYSAGKMKETPQKVDAEPEVKTTRRRLRKRK